jgi:hypothetical protein
MDAELHEGEFDHSGPATHAVVPRLMLVRALGKRDVIRVRGQVRDEAEVGKRHVCGHGPAMTHGPASPMTGQGAVAMAVAQ